MLLFGMRHGNLFPLTQRRIWLVASGSFILNIYLMVLLTGTRLVWLPRGFINALELIIMTLSVQLSSLLLFVSFSAWRSIVVGLFDNLMLIMLFSSVPFLRMYLWHNHKASLIVIILIMSVNCARLFMVLSKFPALGIKSYANFLSPLASLTPMQTPHYLSTPTTAI